MPNYRTEDIRNITLVGHSGTGKTTLVEALLVKSGKIGEAGTIERGTTTTDHDPLEKEFQSSLDSALASLDFDGIHVNLVDTPGFPDFRGPALTGMSATETTALVINAHNGIELSTRRLMRRAKRRQLCRIIIINKIDQEGVNLEKVVREIREEFGPECLPINLPADNLSTVKDCFFGTEGDTDIFSLAEAHEAIIDQVVEVNEELMEKYLEGEELSRDELHNAFEQALREGHLVPICFTSAMTGAGLGEFLRLCKRLLPNPLEGNPPMILKGEGAEAQEAEVKPDPNGHVVAHVFKITNDPFVGKLSIFRIYQGTVRPDTQLFIGDGRKPFKVGHLFKLQGAKHMEVDSGIPGDICAVAKVEDIHYDAILHDSHDEDNFRLKPLDFPQPMYGLAVEPSSRGQEQKLAQSIHKLTEEDPCFVVEHNQELNETVIRGLGELHMRVMLQRMTSRYHVDVDTRPPRIAYRETITRPAEGHYRHKKADRRRRPVRRSFPSAQATGAGRRFRVRQQGRRRLDSHKPDSRRGKRDTPDHDRGRDRRLPVAGHGSHGLRRQISPGRFEGNCLCYCRQECISRRDPQRRPADPGADRQRGRDGTRRRHGGCHRQPGWSPCPNQRHGKPQWRAGDGNSRHAAEFAE